MRLICQNAKTPFQTKRPSSKKDAVIASAAIPSQLRCIRQYHEIAALAMTKDIEILCFVTGAKPG
jgi:hypothetical protein